MKWAVMLTAESPEENQSSLSRALMTMLSKSQPLQDGFPSMSLRHDKPCNIARAFSLLQRGLVTTICNGLLEILLLVSVETDLQNSGNSHGTGITVGAVVVPQGMAYAQLATLPVQFGLYSSFMGVLIYWFFATSKDITIGVGFDLCEPFYSQN